MRPEKLGDFARLCRALGRTLAGICLLSLALAAPAEASAGRARLNAAKSWVFQLQNVNVASLAASSYDVMVVDFSRTGSNSTALSRADVSRLKAGGRHIVLAYMSIGEAERYRDYWNKGGSAHAISGSKGWSGNYTARYWSEGWKDIMYRGSSSYLSRIQAAGFDGVYLDRIDSWEKAGSRAQMIDFVRKISSTAKSRDGSFLIVGQNAEELLDNAAYRAALDGLGKEELLYGIGGRGKPNSPGAISSSTRMLQRLKSEGKAVMVIEYLSESDKIASARQRLRALGFVPYFGNRQLNRA